MFIFNSQCPLLWINNITNALVNAYFFHKIFLRLWCCKLQIRYIFHWKGICVDFLVVLKSMIALTFRNFTVYFIPLFI